MPALSRDLGGFGSSSDQGSGDWVAIRVGRSHRRGPPAPLGTIADPNGMHWNAIDILGLAAGVLTTISFVPQVWHSWTTRDLSGISLRMYGLFALGTLLWLIYGLEVSSVPIALANAITMILASTVLVLKWGHGRR